MIFLAGSSQDWGRLGGWAVGWRSEIPAFSLRPDVNKAEVVLIDLGVSANLKSTPVMEDVSWLYPKGSHESICRTTPRFYVALFLHCVLMESVENQ